MGTDPLDLESLLAEVKGAVGKGGAHPPGTVVGHVHLQVEELERTAAFYRERLGMEVTVSSYPGALFLSWARYHHHLGLNVWGARRRVTPPAGSRGLIGWELRFPGASGGPIEGGGERSGEDGGELLLTDPDGVRIRVVGS